MPGVAVVLLQLGVGIGSRRWRPEEFLLQLVVFLLAVCVVIEHAHSALVALVWLGVVIPLLAVVGLIGCAVSETAVQLRVRILCRGWVFIEILLGAGVGSDWLLRLGERRVALRKIACPMPEVPA